MTYPESLQFLYSLRMFGLKFGLENTLKLAGLAGNPHRQLRFIHVAGTNGKGSTCAVLESIYRAVGLHVGLFTSPHLVSFRERIQTDRLPIPESHVVRLLAALRPLLDRFPADHHPTFFEVVTVMALLRFLEQRCDLVIWETGMGGRLDATNIVTPLASVITPIDLDHQQWLGDTLARIAAEKAGIIKPGVPVVSAPQPPGAAEVVELTATRLGAPLTLAPSLESAFPGEPPPCPGLAGEHQRSNAALAAVTVACLQSRLPVPGETIRRGIECVQWPGRLQLLPRTGGGQLLLDGAHNPGGARVLRRAIETATFPKPSALILGLLGDKSCREICHILAPLVPRIFTVPVQSERTADPQALAAWCAEANPSASVTPCQGLEPALDHTRQDPFVIVTGSLYLVGQALEVIGASTVAGGNERQLNEWSPRT